MGRLGTMAAFGMAVLAGRAAAHAIIIDSVPAPLAHITPGALRIALRYNSRIDAGRSKLTIRHGDDMQRLTTGDADAPDTLVAQTSVAPGEYEIAWQVLATDGHVTRGRIPFTVDPPKAQASR